MALEQTNDPTYVVNEVISRLRSLEGKHSLLSEQVLIINKNMIAEYKQLIRELQTMKEEMKEARNEIFKMKEAMQDFSKELNKFAMKDRVTLLEKYVDFWNPMHFVTDEEVKKLVREEYGKISSNE